jgi:hypothetical protein
MPFLSRRKPRVTRDDALRAVPRRLDDVEIEPTSDGGGRLKVPLAPPRWGWWVFRVPPGATKTFELDAIGVFVWRHCDGRHTVQQIIRKLATEYRLNLREAEVPTIKFLHTLARKGLIRFSVKKTQP